MKTKKQKECRLDMVQMLSGGYIDSYEGNRWFMELENVVDVWPIDQSLYDRNYPIKPNIIFLMRGDTFMVSLRPNEYNWVYLVIPTQYVSEGRYVINDLGSPGYREVLSDKVIKEIIDTYIEWSV